MFDAISIEIYFSREMLFGEMLITFAALNSDYLDNDCNLIKILINCVSTPATSG